MSPILNTENLHEVLQDWLDDNRRKLGHLESTHASLEHWFQTELAHVLLDRWERVVHVPYEDGHVWLERSPESKGRARADLAVGRRMADQEWPFEPDWPGCAVIEVKHVSFGTRRPSGLGRTKQDLLKRRTWECGELWALTLCSHDTVTRAELSEELGKLDATKGLHSEWGAELPTIETRIRGVTWGTFSVALWRAPS